MTSGHNGNHYADHSKYIPSTYDPGGSLQPEHWHHVLSLTAFVHDDRAFRRMFELEKPFFMLRYLKLILHTGDGRKST